MVNRASFTCSELISDETNRKISDRAPADYVEDADIVPIETRDELLAPHFISGPILASMQSATETLTDADADALYEEFLQAREEAIIDEIRRVCGISTISSVGTEPEPPDEVASDVAAREEADEDGV
jgi:hypothetical protein